MRIEFRSEIFCFLSGLSVCIRGLTDISLFAPVVLRQSQLKVQVQKASYIDLRASAEPAGRCQGPRYVWMRRWALSQGLARLSSGGLWAEMAGRACHGVCYISL